MKYESIKNDEKLNWKDSYEIDEYSVRKDFLQKDRFRIIYNFVGKDIKISVKDVNTSFLAVEEYEGNTDIVTNTRNNIKDNYDYYMSRWKYLSDLERKIFNIVYDLEYDNKAYVELI